MRSFLVSEPAVCGDIIILEDSEEFTERGNTFTFYRGVHTRIGSPWKADRSSALSEMQFTSTSHTVDHSVEKHFAGALSKVDGIERIFIRKDNDFVRVWVVIADTDVALEDEIYSAQLTLMDQFPEIPFDFAVIFRQGGDPDSIRPSRALQVYPWV